MAARAGRVRALARTGEFRRRAAAALARSHPQLAIGNRAVTDRLKGKICLVTAAGQGIGRAIAQAFVREGGKVIATDLDAAKVKDLKGAEGQKLDVRHTAEVEKLASGVGPIDVLANCAGYVHHGSVLECAEADWDFSFDLNVKSMHRTIRAFLPGMIEKGGGSIINISSIASSVSGLPLRYVYGASKAAVIGLTKSVAADFIKKGIRANANAFFDEIGGDRLGEADYRRFRRAVDVAERQAAHRGGDRGNVDDRAAALLDHARQKGADRAVHRFHVEVEGEVPIGLRAFEHGAVVHVARAVREHIDRADARRELFDLGRVAHVELLALGALQIFYLGGIEIGRDDFAAFAHEGLRDGPPDSLAGGGYEADFSLQTIRHGSVSYSELRMASSERRCRPPSKFSGASQRSNAARARGHSESSMANHAVSRFLPLIIMCWRKIPSKVKPKRKAARREAAFSASHFHS